MIEAKVIVSHRGSFVLMQSEDKWYIGVLIPNFYPNSHFDVSKDFVLNSNDVQHKDDIDYLIQLAEEIRKDWTKFSYREVKDIKIVK
ncbi:hypothetical protein HQN64_16395 [Enterobacteriaceae bacterium BIT-l23]|uniref:hypothetical protein n=1 Tax=Jejubacter sp. L23 TaxID=3092086 RepID=UPI001584AEAF|nr:hypothetical protein [Enterobacteriaceae bacterium BIT-l23]